MRQGRNHSKVCLRHTASQLAEMGYCERKMLLRLRLGPRTSLSRQAAQAFGTLEHARFLAEAMKLDPLVSSDVSMHTPSTLATTFRRLRRFWAMIGRLFAIFGAGKR